MNARFDLVVMGDVNLDYVVPKFLPYNFGYITNNQLLFSNIEERYGGSGLIFCFHSQAVGYNSLLLSKIGDDIAGKAIVEQLKSNSFISLPPSLISPKPTGRAIIIRDEAQVRLLINNDNNANYQLNSHDIKEFEIEIASCKVLYISGYCINKKEAPRFQATLKAIECAKSSNLDIKPVIVFDVVPHRIYDKYSFDEFNNITKNVDILVSEVATVRRFLGLGSKLELIDERSARETLCTIGQFYDRLILRFGPSGCDKQILWDKKNNQYHFDNETGHAFLNPDDQRGFGDKLTLKALGEFFNILSPVNSTSKCTI